MSKDLASHDTWSSGDLYERYVGRWSRLVAKKFIRWLALPGGSRWLDVGCGTGALSQTILELANPEKVQGIDRSGGFVSTARSQVIDPKVAFQTGDAMSLPLASEIFDAAVSGLVLNFVPQPAQMVDEMVRAVRKAGKVALYVWDYGGMMQFMRHFWNAAAVVDAAANDLDEGRRFPFCNPNSLAGLFWNAGLVEVETSPIDIYTDFKDFEDYWTPFLGGQGSAPGYAMSLSEEKRGQLRDRIHNSLPFAVDGSIPLVARAWAVKGVK